MANESDEQTTSRRGRAKNWIVSHPVYFILIVSGVITLLLMVIFPDAFPYWLGLGEIKDNSGEIVRPQKTVWDWLELLIVPAMLAVGAAWIAQSQQKRELEEKKVDREIANQAREVDRELANQARDVDREIAEKAREADREITKDRQEQTTLENYYDRMAELLLTHDLRTKTGDDDEERSIARARTSSVLRSLNPIRKGQVLRFLHESFLINRYCPVLVLSAIDLSDVDLINADLSGANLSDAIMKRANLVGANLEQANLRGTNLEGGILYGTNLFEADMSRANLLGANLEQANLRGANLSEAQLSYANISWAKYTTDTKWPPNFDQKAAGAMLVEN